MGAVSKSVSRQLLRKRSDDGLIYSKVNGDIGSGVDNTIYIAFAKLNFFRGVIQVLLQNTNVKIYGTTDNDGVADADAVYTDITMTWTGSATKTSSFDVIIDTDNSYSRLKIVLSTTNVTNAASVRLQKIN